MFSQKIEMDPGGIVVVMVRGKVGGRRTEGDPRGEREVNVTFASSTADERGRRWRTEGKSN